MAKPLDEQTDEELETALAQGQLDDRKAATAKEILSRRWQSKSEKIKGSYGWLGHVAATVALALVTIRRLLRGELERLNPKICGNLAHPPPFTRQRWRRYRLR